AALMGRRPATARTISAMTLSSARPSAPRDGSFTSIIAAPAAKAISASAAERTLTNNPGAHDMSGVFNPFAQAFCLAAAWHDAIHPARSGPSPDSGETAAPTAA